MTYPVYIALGSNLGDRLENLRAAVRGLFPSAPVSRISAVYETPPWGNLDQPAFLNMAVEVFTPLPPHGLLDYLQTLEAKAGRVRTILYGPRPIDLDVLFYENQIVHDELLDIPHAHMRGRGFVLLPLADLAGNFIHPEYNLSVRSLLDECDLTGIVQATTAAEFEASLAPDRMLFPEEVIRALAGNVRAAYRFCALPPSHQLEHIRAIGAVNKAETRQRRIQQMLAMLLLQGKS